MAIILLLSNYITFAFLLFLLLFLPSANSLHFKMTRFDPQQPDILYQGDAEHYVGTIEMINNVNYLCRVGWATYFDRVRLWDSTSGKLTDFTSHFSFSINTQGRDHYGHGLAFFLAPVGVQIPPNSAGGFLGLFNTSTSDSSKNHIVLVEFDSFPNQDWDPPFQHVGINNNSIASSVFTSWNASYHSGDTVDALITYNASTKNLSVSWTYQLTSNPRENSSLWYVIDLSKTLPEWVTVGFSAATGQYGAKHTLLSWEFRSSLDVKESNGTVAKKRKIVISTTASLLFLIAGASAVLLILQRKKQSMRRRRRKRTDARNATSINEDLEKGTGPRKFSYEDLASATNNFSNDKKLGQGGFGAVYRGYLTDIDIAIAVKRFSRSSKQGKKEYVTEVKTISQLRHRNLVQLVGWCHDRAEFLLVYELMPNGSLDAHLFGKKRPLNWAVRHKISLGLASALLYVHEEWEQCVVHRDVKPSNIMLDSSFNAKLGDFGLARLMDHELGPQTTGLAGTPGYLAPEYISTGKASKESDVYSFGVVALEIVSGRKANDPIEENPETSLVGWIWDLYGSQGLHLAIDSRLGTDFDKTQVECLMIVGLWCAHPDRNQRPSIRQAIQVLSFEAALPTLPARMPVPMFQAPLPSASSSTPPAISTSIDLGR